VLTVRSAERGDLARAVELLAFGALGPTDDDPSDLGPYQDAFDAIRASPGSDLLVAELDGEVVGVCQLIVFRHFQRRGGLCAEIESVHVHPSHRSQGIGGALVEATIERARAAGCYRVQLTSNNQRVDAHRFYERLGFTPSHQGFKLLL
jgi:GNAT superfamily N-acetyltransferase